METSESPDNTIDLSLPKNTSNKEEAHDIEEVKIHESYFNIEGNFGTILGSLRKASDALDSKLSQAGIPETDKKRRLVEIYIDELKDFVESVVEDPTVDGFTDHEVGEMTRAIVTINKVLISLLEKRDIVADTHEERAPLSPTPEVTEKTIIVNDEQPESPKKEGGMYGDEKVESNREKAPLPVSETDKERGVLIEKIKKIRTMLQSSLINERVQDKETFERVLGREDTAQLAVIRKNLFTTLAQAIIVLREKLPKENSQILSEHALGEVMRNAKTTEGDLENILHNIKMEMDRQYTATTAPHGEDPRSQKKSQQLTPNQKLEDKEDALRMRDTLPNVEDEEIQRRKKLEKTLIQSPAQELSEKEMGGSQASATVQFTSEENPSAEELVSIAKEMHNVVDELFGNRHFGGVKAGTGRDSKQWGALRSKSAYETMQREARELYDSYSTEVKNVISVLDIEKLQAKLADLFDEAEKLEPNKETNETVEEYMKRAIHKKRELGNT